MKRDERINKKNKVNESIESLIQLYKEVSEKRKNDSKLFAYVLEKQNKRTKSLEDDVTSLKNSMKDLIIGNRDLYLRKNLEYFLVFYFNLKHSDRIKEIKASLTVFLEYIKINFTNNFDANKKPIGCPINKSNSKITLADPSPNIIINRNNIERKATVDLNKMKNFVKNLLNKYSKITEFETAFLNIINMYQNISESVHSKKLYPITLIGFDTDEKEYYDLFIALTESCI